MNPAEARAILVRAWYTVIPSRAPTLPEIQAVQAMCALETGYGRGWKSPPHPPEAQTSFNWGAMQGTGPAGFFVTTDTSPQPDGTSKPYQAKFRRYNSDAEGAADVIAWWERRGIFEKVRAAPSTHTASAALRAAGYYEGFGKTQDERIANHRTGMDRNLRIITQALNEPAALGMGGAGAPAGPFPPVVAPAAPEPVAPVSRRAGLVGVAAALAGVASSIREVRETVLGELEDFEREVQAQLAEVRAYLDEHNEGG